MLRGILLFSFLFISFFSHFNYPQESGDSITAVSSRFDVVVSGFIPKHDEDVLQSFLEGYSSYNGVQFSGRAYIHNSIHIFNSLSFANENEYELVIRSYTGLLEAIELADNFPELQIIMPSGSNSFIESFSGDIISCPVIVTGAGISHNVTGYTLEFFSIDPIGKNSSSFSNGYIAGEIAFLADYLGLSYDEARMLARNTASLHGKYDYFNGFGSINLDEAIKVTLPVELTLFTATIQMQNVNLVWRTETEINNLGFEIERKVSSNLSQNGIDSGWLKIGFVPGNGTTSDPQEYFYLDDIRVISSTTLAYRLKQIDFNGTYEYSDEVLVENISPGDFELKQNYPNPFNPSTNIQYAVGSQKFVVLKVYDVLGEEMATLVNEEKSAGTYEIMFDAQVLTSGVYFYTLKVGSYIETKKMIFLR
ncbi:MAG: T9SS type A sorting domain-containing protein [Bacteroidetes bacterium]|nr:T9SS type A sorting domain-containing protein [Bacteroidota bacterium]